MSRGYGLLLAIFFHIGSLLSQEVDPVKLTADIVPVDIPKESEGVLVVTCQIESSFHISDTTHGLFKVSPKPLEGIVFDEPQFPPSDEEENGNVYRSTVEVNVPFTVKKNANEGTYTILVDVVVQPCSENGKICYPPTEFTVGSKFNILPIREEAAQKRTEIWPGIAGRLAQALESGSFIAFFLVFLGGLLTSFTPCVYPMIPITIAVIGAQATGHKLRGFILSLFYVLGVAITFSLLGIIAAKTGALFGSYAQHPVVIILISLIFFLMGLSLLGVFVLQMPSTLSSKFQGKRKGGFAGALVTGLLAGLIVSPCISPLLVVILTWVARSGSVLLGFSLLFSFALGLGVLFILIGTFSGVLKNLPKSGGWMAIIERGFGLLLLILAITLLKPILSPFVYQGIWAIFLVILGTFAGAFLALSSEADWKKKTQKAGGVLLILIGSCLLFFVLARWYGFNLEPSKKKVQNVIDRSFWEFSDEEGFYYARQTGNLVIIDFFAEWCPGCHELDEKTWSDTVVQSELEQFIRIKLDLTKNDNRAKSYQSKYRIVGMPTVIIFNSNGRELGRFVGYQPPEVVLAFLRRY